jgi:hypothetical protein
MKLGLLISCLALLAASCSSFKESTITRKVAAISTASGETRDYQHFLEQLAPLLSKTFVTEEIVSVGYQACNVDGGGGPSTYPNQTVLDKIAFLKSRAFAMCGNDCKGKVYFTQMDTLQCRIKVVLEATELNQFQVKLKNLIDKHPANIHVFAAHASKTPIPACNSKGIRYYISGDRIQIYDDAVNTVEYVKAELEKKCGSSCNIAIDFMTRNETDCIVTGIATPQ